MNFAIPWIAGAATAAAVAVTVLHLLSVRQPRVMRLPTARFIPARDARAVARQARPSDRWLLLLRVLALLGVGGALAGMRCGVTGRALSPIIVIDASRRADSLALIAQATAPVADRAKAIAPTVLWVEGVMQDPGVAIVAAIGEASRQVRAQPSLTALSLTVVLPAQVRSRAGWDAWRGQWPARIRLVSDAPRVAFTAGERDSATVPPERMSRVRMVVGEWRGTDAVEAAFALRGVLAGRLSAPQGTEVVVRRTGRGLINGSAVLVEWPRDGVPAGWRTVSIPDTVGAVSAAGVALVAPLVRTALPPVLSDSVQAIAWWSDGVAAAIERTSALGCAREVALVIDEGSDLLLSPAADGLLRVLRAPCGDRRVLAPRNEDRTLVLAAGTATVDAEYFRVANESVGVRRDSWFTIALLMLALVALLVEALVRRDGIRREHAGVDV
jgi:hypothetical protein